MAALCAHRSGPVHLAGGLGNPVTQARARQRKELMMAGSVLTALMVLLLFLAQECYSIEGILVGSVKK
jgi:ABC-type glycerol-3-phosphate transport system permease component